MQCNSNNNYQLQQMHWDIAKLLELGVNAEWLMQSNVTPNQARDLVKGLLYLKERYTAKKAAEED